MLGQGKKRNATPPKDDDNDTPQIPTKLPPLRTFVLRTHDIDPKTGKPAERQIDAHGLAIDEARMISFVVFFWLDGDHSHPAQTSKLVINSDDWAEVEEINPLFPVLETH